MYIYLPLLSHFNNCCFRVIPRHCQDLSCPINTESVSEELCQLRYVNTLLQMMKGELLSFSHVVLKLCPLFEQNMAKFCLVYDD